MARDFNGSTGILQEATAAISSQPWTFCCNVNPDAGGLGGFQALMACSDGDADFNQAQLLLWDTNVIAAFIWGGEFSSTSALTSGAVSAGTWYHAAATYNGSTLAAFRDGGNKATTSTSIAPSGLSHTTVAGRRRNSSNESFFDGKIGEAAIWDVVLTDAEIAILGDGYSPLLVRPQSLVMYLPTIGRADPEIDPTGGLKSMAVSGTAPVSEHPRVIYPSGSGWVPAFVAGGSVIAVGIATETDTALAATSAKLKAVGIATETDTALAVTVVKTVAVGLTSETDAALSINSQKTKDVGLALETDAALAITSGATIAVGQASETDTALPFTALKTKEVSLASETDESLTITQGGATAVGLATETDQSLAASSLKEKAIGQASDVESALAISVVKTLAFGQAAETNIALSIARLKTLSVGLATETDVALGITHASGDIASIVEITFTGNPAVRVEFVGDTG